MRQLLLALFLLFPYFNSSGQLMEGMIIDKESKDLVANVTVVNKSTGTVGRSDASGNYSITARAGDTIVFRHTAYYQGEEVMPPGFQKKIQSVLLQPLIIKLKEARITGLTKYQKDSLEIHQQFEHELNKTLVPKPKFYGVACVGCIGWLADKITGNSKKPKRFRHNFASEDELKFIDSRYTPALVTSLTGLKDTDSVATFMNEYPMEYSFARAAGDLELKAWIRNSYKQYLQGLFTKK